MAEEETGPEGEAERVIDALKALKEIEDPTARARAISAFLRAYQPVVSELSELRRAYVKGERDRKVPYRKIAADLSVSPSTVQDIERGYSGSGRDRPRKDDDERHPPKDRS
ncbi:helix-turn-helix domain-containing protein [Streptomyces scabiei]|uniref:helix-turn-helix domain-containing protein n=1 Tax=Streptomyces scabiei TaxID=1930 RepID=UPI0038F6F74D